MARQSYPTTPKPSYSYNKFEEYKTLISNYDSGKISKSRQQRFPKRKYDLTYSNITRANRDILNNFFHTNYGAYESFWFVDFAKRTWTDEYIGYQGPLNVTHYCYWDLSASSYSDMTAGAQTSSTGDTCYLLTSTPSVNDANYIGHEAQFDRVTINVTVAATNTMTLAFEYPYGSTGTWAALSNATDNTSGFHITGSNNIGWTIPSSWTEQTINGVTAYWVRFRITASSSDLSTQPLAGQITVNSKTYDLHSKATPSSAGITVYFDGVVGTSWSFVSSGGGGGRDRITLDDYETQGTLITCDMTSCYLSLKGYMDEDRFDETMRHPAYYDCRISIQEEHW